MPLTAAEHQKHFWDEHRQMQGVGCEMENWCVGTESCKSSEKSNKPSVVTLGE